MRWIALCVAGAALAGCVHQIRGPNSEAAYQVRCVAAGCFNIMTRTCPMGYNVIDQTQPFDDIGTRDVAFSCKT